MVQPFVWERYDLLLLEFGSRKELVEWAKKWVTAHAANRAKGVNMSHYQWLGGCSHSMFYCRLRFFLSRIRTRISIILHG